MAVATSMDIYQLKITIKRIEPPIWRRIQISKDSTFKELHHAIVCSVGWEDTHLHIFKAPVPKSRSRFDKREFHIATIYDDSSPARDGTCSIETLGPNSIILRCGVNKLDEAKTKLCDYFKNPEDLIEYEYDLNNTWDHVIVLEKIVPSISDQVYPVCIAGERACPPESCKGVGHYEGFVKVVKNPDIRCDYDDNYDSFLRECKEWLADDGIEDWNPEHFDPKSVRFTKFEE